MIPILDEILASAADAGLAAGVLGMAHRGRLNVLSNIMSKSYDAIFREFEGYLDPNSVQGSGDVKYHLGATGKYVSPSGADISLELAANPSHLETVTPIVEGMVRAMEDRTEPPGSYPVLPILIHGDAAFAGQGVVAETLALSDITGYRVGGTIHLIINNQIGFTTAPEFARSSLYCSDVAKTVQAPIFHVNGDDPEACARVAKLAFEYRQQFHIPAPSTTRRRGRGTRSVTDRRRYIRRASTPASVSSRRRAPFRCARRPSFPLDPSRPRQGARCHRRNAMNRRRRETCFHRPSRSSATSRRTRARDVPASAALSARPPGRRRERRRQTLRGRV